MKNESQRRERTETNEPCPCVGKSQRRQWRETMIRSHTTSGHKSKEANASFYMEKLFDD